jgi:ubiquinone/menaquinone biosynthesis C-methylase UbiE
MKKNSGGRLQIGSPVIVPESVQWQSAHYEEPYYAQRTAKLPSKLQRLGVLDLPRDIRVLDTCCGRGEALAVLASAGFQNLEGIDATPQPQGTKAFTIHHGDATRMPFPDRSFDLVLNLHALHHMGNAATAARFLSECHRILKPGGMLGIIDFPASIQIRLLFWLLRKRLGTINGGLRNFARILEEEWSYLGPYLAEWPQVKREIDRAPFQTARRRRGLFLYYWMMRRSAGSGA